MSDDCELCGGKPGHGHTMLCFEHRRMREVVRILACRWLRENGDVDECFDDARVLLDWLAEGRER